MTAHPHTHGAYCPRLATIAYLDEDGAVHIWTIGATCSDDARALRSHLRAWLPRARWLGVGVEPEERARARKAALPA